MFDDDIRVSFQSMDTLTINENAKDTLIDTKKNFNDLVLNIEGLVDDLKVKANKHFLSSLTMNKLHQLKTLLDNRSHYYNVKKLNHASKVAHQVAPDKVDVSNHLISGLRQEELDEHAVYTNSFFFKVHKLAKDLFFTYFHHDLDKSSGVDKDTISNVKFFDKMFNSNK